MAAFPTARAIEIETSTDAAIVHVLNRITFGLRPDDLARVRAIGLETYIEQQLYPSLIDDRDLQHALARFETLNLDTGTLVRQYHLPALMARRQLQRSGARSAEPDLSGGSEPQTDPEERRRRQAQLPPEMRRGQLIYRELGEQKIIRAVSSERQLQEVLVDFWFNHFNVSVRKGPLIRPFLIEYERDVIRPHVLGSFRNLLGAVAESPAMLIYLDNWLSSDPDALTGGRQNQQARGRSRSVGQHRFRMPRFGFGNASRRGRWEDMLPSVQPGQRNGLNENYARELLELHTLGVDGGYTQQDVVEVEDRIAAGLACHIYRPAQNLRLAAIVERRFEAKPSSAAQGRDSPTWRVELPGERVPGTGGSTDTCRPSARTRRRVSAPFP